MEKEIESFKLLRKHLAMSGIMLRRSSKNLHRFNLKNWAIIILTGLGAITIERPSNEEKIFEEYTDITYRVIYIIVLIIIYIIIVWKTQELNGFVNSLEKRINKSKSKHLYVLILANEVE